MIQHNSQLETRLACGEQDLLAAQRLRYSVFVEELGGDGPLVDHDQCLERDEFDPYFDHLILVDKNADQTSLDYVLGVYRMLTGTAAERSGRYYSEIEYDLSKLRSSGRKIGELGRSCVHRDHRGGFALFQLWQGLEGYIAEREIELLFGVASFHGTDIDALEAPLSYLHHHHLAPEPLRAKARDGWFQAMDRMPANEIDRPTVMKEIPALIKAYLRLGGYVGEGAFVDLDFNTTDILLMMDTAQVSQRQRSFYAGRAHQ
jgi:putative hemolysin